MTARSRLAFASSASASFSCVGTEAVSDYKTRVGVSPLDERIQHVLSICEKQAARFGQSNNAWTLAYDHKRSRLYSDDYVKTFPAVCKSLEQSRSIVYGYLEHGLHP